MICVSKHLVHKEAGKLDIQPRDNSHFNLKVFLEPIKLRLTYLHHPKVPKASILKNKLLTPPVSLSLPSSLPTICNLLLPLYLFATYLSPQNNPPPNHPLLNLQRNLCCKSQSRIRSPIQPYPKDIRSSGSPTSLKCRHGHTHANARLFAASDKTFRCDIDLQGTEKLFVHYDPTLYPP